MLGWSLTFLIVALISGAVAFGGLTGTAVGVAPFVFLAFLAMSLITAVVSLMRP